MIRSIEQWRVDYGDGEKEVSVPHSWGQDVPLLWEGPATYRTRIQVPKQPCALRFHGVSYRAIVKIGGATVAEHRGIWDAFDVSLEKWKGKEIAVEVEVVKNGGPTYPVRDVASGFLPYVFGTFGGIFREVELVPVGSRLDPPAPPPRVRVERNQIFLDGQPFYMRGLLHWGWYPELGHPNPPEATIRDEVRRARELGFNLIKFCLWVPPHRYLEVMEEEGMQAWLELPLWDPAADTDLQAQMAEELRRIVGQYRRHANIVVWTVGCELSESTSPEYRESLYRMVKAMTASPLVKDNSGGAEMYGGDLREFGDLYDFHPYCDTPFYPAVLDSLLPGARKPMPILLGEFNDIDVHRDMARTLDDRPYWASELEELNAQGVRWQYDLPRVLRDSRFAHEPRASRHAALMESSRQKALFIRKHVQEAVRAREAISGYVITGWRDTPISSAGFFDDWGGARFSPGECEEWNGPECLFLIPNRRPPWVHGGNRPGYSPVLEHFSGQIFWRLGLHSEPGAIAGLTWRVEDCDGKTVAWGAGDVQQVDALGSVEIGQIHWLAQEPGQYRLVVEAGKARNAWPVLVVEPPAPLGCDVYDPRGLLSDLQVEQGGSVLVATAVPPDLEQRLHQGARVLLFLDNEATEAAPFWRESAYELAHEAFTGGPLDVTGPAGWAHWLNISPDRVVSPEWLTGGPLASLDQETWINRIDVRTYRETPVMVRATRAGSGAVIVTTLRPWGGLGVQPTSLKQNPAGWWLLRRLVQVLATSTA
jgi:hypothetical protein